MHHRLHDTDSQLACQRLDSAPSGAARICMYLLAFLAAVGPIYWIPGIDSLIIKYTKTAILIFSFSISVFIVMNARLQKKIYAEKSMRILNILLICGVSYFISLLFSNSFSDSYEAVDSYVYAALYVFSLTVIFTIFPINRITNVLKFTLFLFPIISLLIVLSGYGLFPNFPVPPQLLDGQNENAYTLVDYGFSGNGLGGSRTGWGAATAVSSTLLLSLLGWRSGWGRAAAFLTFAIIALSLYQIGARGAFISFIIGSIYVVNIKISSNIKYIIFISLISFLIFIYSILPEDSRFYFHLYGMDRESVLNTITSNRYQTWIYGLESFLHSPIYGVGIYDSIYEGRWAVHNTWLKIAASSGLIGLVPSLILLASFFRLSFGFNREKLNFSGFDVGGPIVSGIVISMLEPGFPLGAFFNTTAFWFAAIVQAHSLRQSKDSYQGGARHCFGPRRA